MRLDNAVGYVMTGIFVIAMLIVGAEMLLGQDLTDERHRAAHPRHRRSATAYGEWARHPVPRRLPRGHHHVAAGQLERRQPAVHRLDADDPTATRSEGRTRVEPGAARHAAAATATATGYQRRRRRERSLPFRAYLLWLTVPPMALLFFDQPFALTLVYGVLGAAFMPFLGVSLILLLNSKRVARDGRSGWLSNIMLTVASALFVVLLVVDLVETLRMITGKAE